MGANNPVWYVAWDSLTIVSSEKNTTIKPRIRDFRDETILTKLHKLYSVPP